MEFNREQIIDALEHCTSSTTSEACNGCPLYTTDICTEMENGLEIYALALIKELIEENDRLNKVKKLGDDLIEQLRISINNKTSELEMLRLEYKGFKASTKQIFETKLNVVKCKKCKHLTKDGYCFRSQSGIVPMKPSADHYCAYGELKER